MPELYSELGKEYAKQYSRHALIQIMNWARTAEEALMDKANGGDEPKHHKWTVLDDDAEFYGDFAGMLQAILDA
jgi:hypothetical protein